MLVRQILSLGLLLPILSCSDDSFRDQRERSPEASGGTAGAQESGSAGRGLGNAGAGNDESGNAGSGNGANQGEDEVMKIVSTLPRDGSVDFERSGKVVISFSQPVDPKTASTAFALYAEGIPAPVEMQIEGAVATLTPVSSLQRDTDYELTLSADIKSVSGARLSSKTIVRFQTADGSWMAPVALESSSDNSGVPEIAIGKDGRCLVAWDQRNESGSGVYARILNPGTGWGEPEKLNQYEDGYLPTVAFTGANVPMVAWEASSNGFHSRTYSNGIWAQSKLVGEAGSWFEIHGSPSNAIASWTQYDAMLVRRWTPAVGWGSTKTFTSADSRDPSLASSGDGSAIFVWNTWSNADGKRNNVWATRMSPEGTWTKAQVIDIQDAYVLNPTVAMDASGNGLVAWAQIDGLDLFKLWTSEYSQEKGWSTPSVTHPEHADNIYHLDLAMNEQGDAILVWVNDLQSSNMGWVSLKPMGQSWSTPIQLELSDKRRGYPRVAIDAEGNAMVAWAQPDETGIWSKRYSKRHGWKSADAIKVSAGKFDLAPRLKAGPGGTFGLAWAQSVGEQRDAWVSLYQ
jgi:hypothetical protein